MILFLKALLYGAAEGISEWLPISSTAHLLLLKSWLPPEIRDEVWELYLCVVQLGAVLAVPVMYPRRIMELFVGNRRKSAWKFWEKIGIAMLPAVIAGLLFDGFLTTYLYKTSIIAIALIGWGVVFLVTSGQKDGCLLMADALTAGQACAVGVFQMFALIPGTSRSGATLLGTSLIGMERSAGAEFSFLLALPMMLGASGWKLIGYLRSGVGGMTGEEWMFLAVGTAVAFLVSLATVRFLVGFVRRHTFAPFGIYRILLGSFILLFA